MLDQLCSPAGGSSSGPADSDAARCRMDADPEIGNSGAHAEPEVRRCEHERGGKGGSGGGEGPGDLPIIPAGWPEETGDGCVELDPAAVLRATPRSFALRVRGQSMVGADIYDGDIVVGEFTPEARPGAIVVALIDGESTLKRLLIHQGRPYLVSENPSCPNLTPLSELVIQGVVHAVVRRVR